MLEEAASPLESKPGTAQGDFGEAPFKYGVEMIKLPYLVMSLPYIQQLFLFSSFFFRKYGMFIERPIANISLYERSSENHSI